MPYDALKHGAAGGTPPASAPPPRGVQHKVAEAKKLRKQYARKKLEFQTAEQDWYRGRRADERPAASRGAGTRKTVRVHRYV